jgi:hypothetical protein
MMTGETKVVLPAIMMMMKTKFPGKAREAKVLHQAKVREQKKMMMMIWVRQKVKAARWSHKEEARLVQDHEVAIVEAPVVHKVEAAVVQVEAVPVIVVAKAVLRAAAAIKSNPSNPSFSY